MFSDPNRSDPATDAPSFKSRLADATGADATQRVLRLAECARDAASVVEIGAVMKAIDAFDKSPPPHTPKISVYVAGNATLQPMVNGIRLGTMARGVVADVLEAPFDQWADVMLNPDSNLLRLQPDFLVLYLCSLGLTAAGTSLRGDVVDLLASCLAGLWERSHTRVAIVLPEPLEEERDPSSMLPEWRATLCDAIRRLSPPDRMLIIDPGIVVADIGAERWFAPRYWYHAKLPCHPLALTALGRMIGNSLAAARVRPKVIVCDLDNTLWGGILGEDGWHGLALDVHSGGGPYLRLQAFLKERIARGFLLAAVSKNNEADVREVFARRRDMLLAWDDFVCVHANWEPKSENLRRIAEQLDLSLQSFIFLDDSPFERAEVRKTLPEIHTPELPSAADDYVPFLLRSGMFSAPFPTTDDRRRHAYYRQDLARQKARNTTANLDDFLASIELRMEELLVDTATLDRAVQLLHKTNQFNLTTRRHNMETVAAMADDPETFARCYRVTDRFGDNGVVGVLIAVPDGEKACRIDTWLLSCRVIGRTVERAMFATLCRWAAQRGIRHLVGEYVPTAKNQVVASLFRDLGFDAIEGRDTLYRYDTEKPYCGNLHVRIQEDTA